VDNDGTALVLQNALCFVTQSLNVHTVLFDERAEYVVIPSPVSAAFSCRQF
jgi:hypothetical protein